MVLLVPAQQHMLTVAQVPQGQAALMEQNLPTEQLVAMQVLVAFMVAVAVVTDLVIAVVAVVLADKVQLGSYGELVEHLVLH